MTGAGIRRFLSFLMEDDKYKGKGCDKNEPKLVDVGNGHLVACHLVADK